MLRGQTDKLEPKSSNKHGYFHPTKTNGWKPKNWSVWIRCFSFSSWVYFFRFHLSFFFWRDCFCETLWSCDWKASEGSYKNLRVLPSAPLWNHPSKTTIENIENFLFGVPPAISKLTIDSWKIHPLLEFFSLATVLLLTSISSHHKCRSKAQRPML